MDFYLGSILKIKNKQIEETYEDNVCPKCNTPRNSAYCPVCGTKVTETTLVKTRKLNYYEVLEAVGNDEYFCIQDNNEALYFGFNTFNDYHKSSENLCSRYSIDSFPLKPEPSMEYQLWKNLILVCEKLGLEYSIEFGIMILDW